MLTLLLIAAADPWVRPPALRPGDTVAFVAPAGPADPDRVGKARLAFEKQGYTVRIPAGMAARKDRYLAGSDADRAAELNAAFRDPAVRAVVAVKGGFGLTRIVDRLDYPALRADPKIVAGFSDLTALHLAVARRCRLVTLHAPMPQFALYRDDGPFGYSGSRFWLTVRGTADSVVPLPADRPRPRTVVPGTAVGRLVGGNLSLVAATVGTPFEVEPDGNLLFLEDTGERAYRLDRMLSQLRLAGLLGRFAGVVLGTFDGTDPGELEAVVRDYFGASKVPVLADFPVGHTPHNATLPHGGRAELDATAGTLRLLDPAVGR
jgi:muramoyltetrapeptide carboxypeptidase